MFVGRFHIDIVQRQEGLWLSALLLDVLDATARRLLRVDHHGNHVLAQHFGHRQLVALVNRLTQIDKTPILKKKRNQPV